MESVLPVLLVWLVIIIFIVWGYGLNIYKLCKNNFKAPFKSEIIRTICIFAVPLGVFVGYFDFDEEKQN